ncbi:MAG: Rrf2 family transcriptional regulator [Actinobacteria bacterium]|nr:Rrf2 family transcriptional regulator [Actinomycetota bacterium]
MLDERLGVRVTLEDEALGLIVVEVDFVVQRACVLGLHYLHSLSGQALHSRLILATADAPISVVDLARFQQIPERYLAKVFTRMKDAQLVVETEGIAGGFALTRRRLRPASRPVEPRVRPDRVRCRA